ncbi:bacteriocin-like protein [Chryseobacterium ginsenosidimutans]|uniref:bacteriocin-like protein n=1 Tax=Chryseobacterium ginsenosidimutans TaxID=687846 RepID=UPI0031E1576E
MKNLKKISREQMKSISGAGIIRNCSYKCCPDDGRPRCPGLICPAVLCPQLA